MEKKVVVKISILYLNSYQGSLASSSSEKTIFKSAKKFLDKQEAQKNISVILFDEMGAFVGISNLILVQK